MTAPKKIDMQRVAELTRAGKLKEALSVLRGSAVLQPPAVLSGFLDRFGAPGIKRPAAQRRAPQRPAAKRDNGQFTSHDFANAAGARPYKLYVPRGYHGQRIPLVVMLHGCTQSPDDFAAGTGMNVLAEEKIFFVAYPAQTKTANMQKCWNWFNEHDQRRGAGEPAIIAGITRQICMDYAVDERRVYVAGLSAGGAAAVVMGAAYPEIFAAVGVHSGLACGAARGMAAAFSAMQRGGHPAPAAAPIPTIVFHGDQDSTVNALNGVQIIEQAAGAGAFRREILDGEAGGMAYTKTLLIGTPMLEHWVLHGGGHAWSGGDKSGSFTDPRGPNASREMLRFFLEHPKPQIMAGLDPAIHA